MDVQGGSKSLIGNWEGIPEHAIQVWGKLPMPTKSYQNISQTRLPCLYLFKRATVSSSSVKVRNRRQSAASPRATDRHRVQASTSEHSLVVPRGDAEGALCSLTCADAADTPGLRERPGSELPAKHGAGTSSARDVADMMSPGSVSWTQTA